jgi:hypothetical protein
MLCGHRHEFFTDMVCTLPAEHDGPHVLVPESQATIPRPPLAADVAQRFIEADFEIVVKG